MRSREAVAVPGDLDAPAAGYAASHAGPWVGGSRWPGHSRSTQGVSGHGRAPRPDTARAAECLKALRAFTPAWPLRHEP